MISKSLLKLEAFFRPGLSEEDRVFGCCADFRHKLEQLNASKYNELCSHLDAAVHNFIANARYRFVESGGPKIGKVTAKEPLMH